MIEMAVCELNVLNHNVNNEHSIPSLNKNSFKGFIKPFKTVTYCLIVPWRLLLSREKQIYEVPETNRPYYLIDRL